MPSIIHQRYPELTGVRPGFEAGDLGVGDTCLDVCRLDAIFQQVPHINTAIIFPNEEDSWSGQGPASHGALHLKGW